MTVKLSSCQVVKLQSPRISRMRLSALSIVCCLLWAAKGQADCQVNIRPDSVADSWQSSSFVSNQNLTICFKGSRAAANAWGFFYTAESNSAENNGFHWFVVKLTQLTAVTSVVIKSRVDSGELKIGSADDIEVWTSVSDMSFGSDHCSSRSISSLFESTKAASWKFCGRSSAKDIPRNVQELTVPCRGFLHYTKFILLRKFVGNETQASRMCMNFVDLRLESLEVGAEISPASSLVHNSKVNVSCFKSCGSANLAAFKFRLCRPNGSCCENSAIEIERLQPSDSGNYTCQIDGQVVSRSLLTVLYPPNELKISATDESSCSAESPADVSFTFGTSAAEPTPVHWCVANSSMGNVAVMRLGEQESGERGSVTSHWLCANCTSVIDLTMHCNAALHGLWNRSAQLNWQCGINNDQIILPSLQLILSVSLVLASILALIAVLAVQVIKFNNRSTVTVAVHTSSGSSIVLSQFPGNHEPAASDGRTPVGSEAARCMSSSAVMLQPISEPAKCSDIRAMSHSHSAADRLANSTDTVYLEIIGDGPEGESEI